MQTFEELLKQETLDFCVSGHHFDSGMELENLLEYYRARNLREDKNVEFPGSLEGRAKGSRFYVDDLIVLNVYSPPKPKRLIQAQALGVKEIKSHVDILPSESFHKEDWSNVGRIELRQLIDYHYRERIPATCYIQSQKEFQGINIV
ncbi:MAG: hypothetical protein AABX32_07960 [Nanoarchaeota archaeon]